MHNTTQVKFTQLLLLSAEMLTDLVFDRCVPRTDHLTDHTLYSTHWSKLYRM